jgi:hypothetical protein
MQSRKSFIPCTIEPGMFRDEFAVEIQTRQGIITLFADKSLIHKRGGQDYLEVNVGGVS